jgi:hypothetical protein
VWPTAFVNHPLCPNNVALEFGKIGDDGFHLEVLTVNSSQVRFIFKKVRVLKVDLERGLLRAGELHQGFVNISRQVAGVCGWTVWRGDYSATVKDVQTVCRDPTCMLERDAAADPAGAKAKVYASFARGFECGPGAFWNSVFANECAVNINQDEFDHNREYR